jgi:hypothetical protein
VFWVAGAELPIMPSSHWLGPLTGRKNVFRREKNFEYTAQLGAVGSQIFAQLHCRIELVLPPAITTVVRNWNFWGIFFFFVCKPGAKNHCQTPFQSSLKHSHQAVTASTWLIAFEGQPVSIQKAYSKKNGIRKT